MVGTSDAVRKRPYPPHSGLDPLDGVQRLFKPRLCLEDLPPTYDSQEAIPTQNPPLELELEPVPTKELKTCCTHKLSTYRRFFSITNPVLRIEQIIQDMREPDLMVFKKLLSDYHQLAPPEQIDVHRLLRFAISKGQLSLARHLIEVHGASVLKPDTWGRVAIFYLAISNNFELAMYIAYELSTNIAQSSQDAAARTALWYAIKCGADETAIVLLALGAQPPTNSTDFDDYVIDREEILRVLGFYRFVQSQPETGIHVLQPFSPNRFSPKNFSPAWSCNVQEFQRNPNWLSREVWPNEKLTWIHCASTTVS